ncbi:nitroreductase family protein [bacterium]|nr:nitroreductase family protein [bacterium]
MNFNLEINKEKCIQCGLCIRDCMPKIITFNENKEPVSIKERENSCINCQHCLAVCPTGALSINGKRSENSQNIEKEFNSEMILNLIKSRRSIRHFRKENVSAETLEKLKDMLDYVPTGVNNHGLFFSVIENKEVMDELRKAVNDRIIKIVSNKAIKPIAKTFERYTDAILKGEDIVFRGAPHIIVASTPKNAPCKDYDGTIALSYFELYAKSLGIATCWCGLAYACFKYIPGLKSILNIPRTHDIAYCMLFGYPEINYTRTTQPEKVPVRTIKEIKIKESFWSKLFE